jgi:hypothetical protein
MPLLRIHQKNLFREIHTTEKDFWRDFHLINTRGILPLIPANMPKRYLPSPYSCFLSFKSANDMTCRTAYLFVGRVQLIPSWEEQQT